MKLHKTHKLQNAVDHCKASMDWAESLSDEEMNEDLFLATNSLKRARLIMLTELHEAEKASED